MNYDNYSGQQDERWLGEPPQELVLALYSWFHNELSPITYKWLRIGTFSLAHESILTTNPKFCENRVRARVKLCGNNIALTVNERTTFVEYGDPKMFEKVECFINTLPGLVV